MRQGESLQGVIEAVNARGVKLRDQGWTNYSYSLDGDMIARSVQPGDTVHLGIDDRGYVQDLTMIEKAPEPAPASVAVAAVDRDTRIMRQALLNTAVSIFALNIQAGKVDHVMDGDVMALAESLEVWVLRPEAATSAEAENDSGALCQFCEKEYGTVHITDANEDEILVCDACRERLEKDGELNETHA
jgi:hypothetical protein